MIRQVKKEDFMVPHGKPAIYHELAWYAMQGDRVLGVVVYDKADKDYGYVVLTNFDGGPFSSVDAGSCTTQQAATKALHKAMQRKHDEKFSTRH